MRTPVEWMWGRVGLRLWIRQRAHQSGGAAGRLRSRLGPREWFPLGWRARERLRGDRPVWLRGVQGRRWGIAKRVGRR